MKRLLLIILAAFLLLPSIGARCLVVTLKGGQRMAFQLDDQNVVMTHSDTQLTFNGLSIDRSQIQEFRIHEQTPKDAIAVGVESVRTRIASAPYAVYDLSGRRVQQLRPGIYVINKKKVVIR